MITRPASVLVVGATGSIGRLVVEESIREGYPTRALVRDPDKARRLPAEADIVVGDVTRPETLSAAVAGIDGIVFTLGSDGAGKTGAETVDYGGVRNVLIALGARPARVALMTSIGGTNRTGAYNRATEAMTGSAALSDWSEPAVIRTRSCDPDGSITTSPMTCDLSCCRATRGMPVTPAMVPWLGARSHRSWFEAWPRMQQCARRLSSSLSVDRPRRTSTPCFHRYRQIRRVRSTARTTSRTCH